MTMKWIEVNDFSSVHDPVNKNLSIKTSMLRSDFCNDSDAYIDVKGTITLDNNATRRNKKTNFSE